ncbi:methyltransferase domain-containing protein [Flavobacterium sp.]|uniref:methyltransferase domain-containing protein n=1 Tax=Flavobacterium sp. TaxID=239 RepID=UPI003753E764
MSINIKNRTDEPEIMDDFALEGIELQEALDKIAKINQLLGGNKLTLQGIKILLEGLDKSKEYTIVDIGCGNGDMLRYIADFGEENEYNFNLIGIDANAFTINHAKKLSNHFPNISYKCEDIFDKQFDELKYDIILCTLTLHHFKNDEILDLVKLFYRNSGIGIVINDLHRSKVAYRLFEVVCKLFNLNKMSHEDGLVSILRGFKKEELVAFSEKLGFKNYSLQWKWAFRYQWIIKKNI